MGASGSGEAGGPSPIRLCLPLLAMSPAQGSLEAHALGEPENAVAMESTVGAPSYRTGSGSSEVISFG